MPFHCPAPSAPPRDVDVMVIDSYSIYLEWNPPSDQSQNGVIDAYVVNITAAETGERAQWVEESTNLTLNSLTPHTTYLIEVAAQTSAGLGPYSAPVTAMTTENGTYRQTSLHTLH